MQTYSRRDRETYRRGLTCSTRERVEALAEHADVIVAGDENVDLGALLGELYRRASAG